MDESKKVLHGTFKGKIVERGNTERAVRAHLLTTSGQWIVASIDDGGNYECDVGEDVVRIELRGRYGTLLACESADR